MQQQFERDYYKFLGVDRNASQEAIHRAFRQKSRDYHPDKVVGNEELMKHLTRIKVTLLDPDKKEKYDDTYEPDVEDMTQEIEKLYLYSGRKLSESYVKKFELWKKEIKDFHLIINTEFIGEKWIELRDKLREIPSNSLPTVTPKECKGDVIAILRLFVYTSEFKSLVEFVVTHPDSRPALQRLHTELTRESKLEELPNSFRAMLSVMKACALALDKEWVRALDSLKDALYAYPVESVMDAIIILIQSGQQTEQLIERLMVYIRLEEPVIPSAHKHVNRLKGSPMLRTITRYEKNVGNQDINHFEKAMLYIDLCIACGNPAAVANNLCLAATHLIHSIRKESEDLPTVYALRNTICDLCGTVLVFTEKYLDPMAMTSFALMAFNLMSKANDLLAAKVRKSGPNTKKPMDLIGDNHKNLFHLIIQLLTKSVKVNPMPDITLALSADLFFVNLVNHQFLERYYNHMIGEHPTHPLNYLYKYYLFEGTWKEWFDQDNLSNTRFKCMESLMDRKGLTVDAIEKTLLWPTIRREPNGWIDRNNRSLNLPGKTYTSVDGLTLDLENGSFEILLSQRSGQNALICDQDINEILSKGLDHGVFSLDQADFELNYFPFQLMRYLPAQLKNTNYLATLFHADYLLKMFTMDTEVSAKKPFEFQNGQDGFHGVLPDNLKKLLKIEKSKDRNFGRAHRFWIEADELIIGEEEVNQKKKISFLECQMLVKEHLLRHDSDGELVDDNDNDEDFCDSLFNVSPEKRFAQNFTDNYDTIGQYFPIFLRLRELLKLNAILTFLRNIYQNMKDSVDCAEIDQDLLRNILADIRAKVTYPLNTETRINERFQEVLRDNNISSESQVRHSEVVRVKNDIKQALINAEATQFNNLSISLIDGLALPHGSNIMPHIRNWIINGHQTDLVNELARLLLIVVTAKRRDKLARFKCYFESRNVSLDNSRADGSMSEGSWVPAALSTSDDRKCYGGVCLIPKVTPRATAATSTRRTATASAAGGGCGGGGGDDGEDKPKFKKCKLNTQHFRIKPGDLGTGQSTQTDPKLASDVRSKGVSGDDAGHIRGNVLGGQMSMENLVPQSLKINRGLYRKFENRMKKFLEANRDDPHVSVNVKTQQYYYCGQYERPFGLSYEIEFVKNGNKRVAIEDLRLMLGETIGKGMASNPIKGIMLNRPPKLQN